MRGGPRDLNWAISVVLEAAQLPVSPKYVAAFLNSSQNQQWIYSVVRKAQPQVGGMTSTFYLDAIEILTANGIKVNPYASGSG